MFYTGLLVGIFIGIHVACIIIGSITILSRKGIRYISNITSIPGNILE